MTRNAGPAHPVSWWVDRVKYKYRRTLDEAAMMAREIERGRHSPDLPSLYDWRDLKSVRMRARAYVHARLRLQRLPADTWLNIAEFRLILDTARTHVVNRWDKFNVRAERDMLAGR